MNLKKRLDLIKRNTAEIVTENKLKALLKEKKNPVSYWGIAPTGPPHIGYYRAIAKQLDLVSAGCKHKVLIADIHAYLDDMKSPWKELDVRSKVYTKCLQLLGLKGSRVEYVKGSDFQLNKKYHIELLKSSALSTVKRALRAGSEVVRQKNPKVSSLIYPLMQSLDCWALDVDIAYSGIDNRHVYMHSAEFLPKLKIKVPTFVFTLPGISLSGAEKMSASEKANRIELFASEKDIRKKINKAYCPAGKIDNNPILDYVKYLILPKTKKFKIERPAKFGGDLDLREYGMLEALYTKEKLHPMDLKNATAKYLIEILKPIRVYFEKHKDLLKTFK